jgi:hypothetical protein
MLNKTPRWYAASVKHNAARNYCGLYLNVRKSHVPGMVVIWNGRYFITTIPVEKAQTDLEIGSVMKDQARLNDDFSWYLNY